MLFVNYIFTPYRRFSGQPWQTKFPQPIPHQITLTLRITPGHHQHIQLQRSSALDHSSHQNPSWTYLKSNLIWLFYMRLLNSKRRWRDLKKGRSRKCRRISREDGLGSLHWLFSGLLLIYRCCDPGCLHIYIFFLYRRFDVWCHALMWEDAEKNWEEILPPIDVLMVCDCWKWYKKYVLIMFNKVWHAYMLNPMYVSKSLFIDTDCQFLGEGGTLKTAWKSLLVGFWESLEIVSSMRWWVVELFWLLTPFFPRFHSSWNSILFRMTSCDI